jgi:preprotein translocase subunit SecG
MISSIALIVSVLLQDEKTQGLGAITGEGDSFFNKSMTRNRDALLRRITTISAAIFMISALALVAL